MAQLVYTKETGGAPAPYRGTAGWTVCEGTIHHVHYAGSETEQVSGRTSYDVMTHECGLLTRVLSGDADNGSVSQWEEGQWVAVDVSPDKRTGIIRCGVCPVDAQPTVAHEATKLPTSGGYNKTNAAGHTFAQSAGIMGTVVSDEADNLPDTARDQQGMIDRARLIENLPQLLQGPLYLAVMSTLQPVISAAIAGSSAKQSAQLAPLEALGVPVALGAVSLARKAGYAEAADKAEKLVSGVIRIVAKVSQAYRIACELRTFHTTLPTSGEIRDEIEKALKAEVPIILKNIVTTAFTGKKPSYRNAVTFAVIGAEQAVRLALSNVLSSVLAGGL